MQHANVVGLILTGGLSKRMGQDKAKLNWEGHSFLEIAWDRLKSLGLAHIFICGEHTTYPSIPDRVNQAGPAYAIINAMQHEAVSHSDLIMVLPIDMPCLQPNDLSPLLQLVKEGAADSAFYQDYPLPCVIKTKALAALLPQGHALQHISMLKLLTQLMEPTIPPLTQSRQTAFVNINTPLNYADLTKTSYKESESAC